MAIRRSGGCGNYPFITKSDELLREMEDFQAVVQKGLEIVSGMFVSFNKTR